ncbi:GNAT family N-acetyltransferase [Kibdelosporangium aridum]|uniref:GNAT family N-acetyltransferase n=1 Tax=Kibdelosporangium aridum TaxID=2030 RepID=UPI00068C0990
MGLMVEINFLTAADRADWEVLARGFQAHFQMDAYDEAYEQTWRRLLDREQIRGIAARLDGKMVGIAHYYFHTSVWAAGNCRCYLQDLFVDKETRRKGVALALIEWLAQDAERNGATRLHWHTPQDNVTARALYDKVAQYKGYIAYSRRLNAAT